MNSKEDDYMTHNHHRARWLLTIALTAIAGAAGAMLMTSSVAVGSPSSAQYEYGTAPVNTALPVISGTYKVGQTLSVTNGTWTSASAISSYTYRWGRCDTAGNTCVEIANATANTYLLAAADQGHTMRAYVWANNSGGQALAQALSPAIAAGTGVTGTTGKTIAAAGVVLPNRLTIDKATYSQSPIRSRQLPTQMRIHVLDAGGNSVQNALVNVLGIPYSRIGTIPEVRTDSTGWATVNLVPAQFFPRTGYLVLFVRARVDGQDPLAGSSTRRLVQVTIQAPNGS